MSKLTLSLFGLVVLAASSRAEVVLTPGTYNSGTTGNTGDISSGFTFTTTGSSAGSGRWRLTDLQFGLGSSTAGKVITGFDVFLYKANGVNWDYVTGGTQSGAGGNVDIGQNNLFNLAFNPNAAFGQAGVENSGLEAGATYLLGINISGANAADIYFSSSNTAASGLWGSATSKWNTSSFSTSNITSGINNWQSGENMFVRLDAAAVPEPGTLILGGIAAVSGGAGAWWRRRKNKKATAEQAA
jgi:hypothetical protein